MSSNRQLVVALRGTARDLAGRRSIRDLDETLAQIVATAVETVPGADAAGISIVEDGQVASRNPTSPSASKLDELQAELHEGPCITAMEESPADGMVAAEDLDGDDDARRWPRFAPQAVYAGYRAMLSSDVSTTGGKVRAALNLYAASPRVFDPEAQVIAGLFSAQVALLLYGSEHAVRLTMALETRDVIGQAKGILIERFGVGDEEAFQMLVRSSQETNVKLVDVARWLQAEAGSARRRR